MRRNHKHMAEMLEPVVKFLASESSTHYFQAASVMKALQMYEPEIVTVNSEMPDQKYFQYFLKTSWDMRVVDSDRGTNWTAGHCYEFEDGRVEIWTGNRPYTVYKFPSISETRDWMLD